MLSGFTRVRAKDVATAAKLRPGAVRLYRFSASIADTASTAEKFSRFPKKDQKFSAIASVSVMNRALYLITLNAF